VPLQWTPGSRRFVVDRESGRLSTPAKLAEAKGSTQEVKAPFGKQMVTDHSGSQQGAQTDLRGAS
jgi:hypothetical protein